MKWIGLVLIEFSVECGVWCVQVADFIGTEHFGFTFTVQVRRAPSFTYWREETRGRGRRRGR